MPHRDSIVIVGCGIIGLNAALVLAEKGYGHCTTIIAEFLPGDTSIRYTSPWAGCNFSAISGSDENAKRWDRLGYAHLAKLAEEQPRESFVQKCPSTEYWDDSVPREKIQNMSEYLRDFRVVLEKDLPEGVQFGVSFTTFTVNAPEHIKYLHRRLRDEYGVSFKRQKLPNLQAGFSSPNTTIVFNCTGNAAQKMPGVEDTKCYSTRGQVVLVRAPWVSTNMMRHGRDYETYVIPRPFSNGNVVLGGYMQKGNSDGSTYGYETDDILKRTRRLHPQLYGENLEVLSVNAGLRPSRDGGARVERDDAFVAGGRRHATVIHNYGAGGTGFQAGYGMALESVECAEEALRKLRGDMAAGSLRARM